MGRYLRNVVENELVTFPLTTPVYHTFEEIDSLRDRRNYTQDRAFAPYQPGEMMLFLHADTVKLGRVYVVHAEYLEGRGYYIPRYRVQFMTKTGQWSKLWLDIYPGFIYRAHYVIHTGKGKEDTVIEYPAEIASLEDFNKVFNSKTVLEKT